MFESITLTKASIIHDWINWKRQCNRKTWVTRLYRLFNVGLPGTSLVPGINTIYLTQSNATSPFQGVMYDYIRLEAPQTQ
ncbi:hypothetical protein PHJA_001883800 [Phtheirospermum japonicum]|uniref:Rhamnogalacturonan lyase domain-containing protein n=1 Tax=Phtheirospermum japonicum TaxID=374723 RepID=A0A830C9H3_9LAMI|nr:hypothetical protein PHJA_001883800 [Phtheirospermum japonicum]